MRLSFSDFGCLTDMTNFHFLALLRGVARCPSSAKLYAPVNNTEVQNMDESAIAASHFVAALDWLNPLRPAVVTGIFNSEPFLHAITPPSRLRRGSFGCRRCYARRLRPYLNVSNRTLSAAIQNSAMADIRNTVSTSSQQKNQQHCVSHPSPSFSGRAVRR